MSQFELQNQGIMRLWHLEFDDRVDLVLRTALVSAIASALYFYTFEIAVLVWLAGHLVFHGLYYFVLNLYRDTSSAHVANSIYALLLISLIWYAWLPALSLLRDDPAIRFVAICALVVFLIYLMRRSDTVLWLIIGQVLIVAALTLFAESAFGFTQTDPITIVLFALPGGGLIWFFASSLFQARRRALDVRHAEEQAVQVKQDETIRPLVAGVAHDFSNILTSILGNLELYAEVREPRERDRFVADAHTSTIYAIQLISHLQSYAGPSVDDIKEHDIGDVLRKVRLLSKRFLPRHVSVSFAPRLSMVSVAVDERQLIVAVINLLMNAGDAIADRADGEISVQFERGTLDAPLAVAARRKLPEGEYAVLHVRDNGPGIAPDVLERVTQPFFSTKAGGIKSGLGLTMVQEFAMQSGGGVLIESRQGQTDIRIYLPQSLPPACSGQPSEDPKSGKTKSSRSIARQAA